MNAKGDITDANNERFYYSNMSGVVFLGMNLQRNKYHSKTHNAGRTDGQNRGQSSKLEIPDRRTRHV